MLDTDDGGWCPPERDLDEMKSRIKLLFEYYISKSPDEVKKMGAFPLDVNMSYQSVPLQSCISKDNTLTPFSELISRVVSDVL
jgi:hypothetical protein